MEKRKLPDWLDSFIESFGSENAKPSGYATQEEFVKSISDQTNSSNSSENGLPVDNSRPEISKNLNSKNNTEVIVQRKKDKTKDGYKDMGMTVQFASGKNKEKIISADIQHFCNGKYASLINESIDKVAKIISDDSEFINKYIEASAVKYSDDADLEEVINLINNLNIQEKISHQDYRKISSKLNNDNIKAFDKYLEASGIQVINNNDNEKINYYVDYIKNFSEYKLIKSGIDTSKNMKKLKLRIASIEPNIISVSGEKGLNKLKSIFKTDEILNQL